MKDILKRLLPALAALAIALGHCSFASAQGTKPAAPLRYARDVLNLEPGQARREVPVTLRGVITYFKPEGIPDLIVQDNTGGLFVNDPGRLLPLTLQPGTEIEVDGVTDLENFAPRINLNAVRLLGNATLPQPQRVSLDDLHSGRFDTQYVEVDGVVRSATIDGQLNPPRLILRVATPSAQLDAWVLRYGAEDPKGFVDARVRSRGVCNYWDNRRRQPVNLRLLVNSLEAITIDRPGIADPFQAPLVPITELLNFRPDGIDQHRQRARGVVTLGRPGEYLIMQNGKLGLKVRLSGPTNFMVGDEVEVSGFAGMTGWSAELQEACVRVTGHPGPPEPERFDLHKFREYPSSEDIDQKLVEVLATLRLIRNTDHDTTLLLDADGVVFQASLPTQASERLLATLTPGCFVRVVGVVDLTVSPQALSKGKHPETFALLLRDGSDITVIRGGPWLTVQRLTVLLIADSAVLSLVLLRVLVLRRRVKSRTSQLAREIHARHDAQVEFDAVLRERNRMAAELHDTLEQGLTGTALQLQAAQLAFPNDPAQSQEHLEVARELLVRSRKDLRQSLWQLRSETGRPTDLVGELRDIACKMTLGTRVHIEVCAANATDLVSELVANHALRIGQEALTNALKHGRAKSIRVEVQCVECILVLRVADDGAGFDIQTVAGAESGHFGIQGMVQRAKQLAGSLTIQSVRGHGTTIILRAPLNGSAVRPPVSGAST